MYFLVAGAILFFGVHFYSAVRSRVPGIDARERLGHAKFMAIYSLIATLGFILMIWGYVLARPSPQIIPTFSWGYFVPWVFMLPAFILLVSAYMPRGRIKQSIKHPMLFSTLLWSLGHLFANGELNSLILFGGFSCLRLSINSAYPGAPSPSKKYPALVIFCPS